MAKKNQIKILTQDWLKCIINTKKSKRIMKVETFNLTSLPLCLTVVGIQTREIAVQ